MTDPLTVGALVAAALGMAGEAVLKGAVGEAVKDGYKTLRDKVAGWADKDVRALEQAPTSAARRAVIAEILDAKPLEEVTPARDLAEQLIAALKAGGASTSTGLDIGSLHADEAIIREIKVRSGTGARIGEAHVSGTFAVEKIDVGNASGKS
ncbi:MULTISPECIES: hypothetical protein [unclassified Bradyrhizobium]